MTKYNETHIEYKGESNGVHSWSAPSGQPYYWHPDWLHIAEDETGTIPHKELDLADGEKPTEKHAIRAILSHLNEWAEHKLSSAPDIETQAHESEINLKK